MFFKAPLGIVILWGVFLCSTVQAQDKEYLAELVLKAEELKLSETPQWHAFLHYLPNTFDSGYTSLADDPKFFNAKNGKTNPGRELSATLASFFLPPEKGVQHPQCRFVARFNWLHEQLDFNSSKLPRFDCPKYDEWLEVLNPEQATLVFPSTYMNNPASMFGHTLLRIDAKNQNEKTRLLAYAANYAAKTDGSNAVLYALKGLVGYYNGYFSVMPYYERVKKYSDLEKRDIWEYELDLNQREVRRLVEHLWELQNIGFDYFYFDENCSYHLLSLLDVARPSLDLIRQFYLYAIPVDTIKEIQQRPGLVKKIVFRPSLVTKLEDQLEKMSDDNRRIAVSISKLETKVDDTLQAEEKFKVFSAAYDLLQLEQIKGNVEPEDAKTTSFELLSSLSQLNFKTDEQVLKPDIHPEDGHGSARISLGGGYAEDLLFSEFSFRPAYHDLLDASEGYKDGAQIEFLSGQLRGYENRGFELENLSIVSVRTISPKTYTTSPKAWSASFGLYNKRFSEEKRADTAYAKISRGLAYHLSPSVRFYGMAQASLEYTGHYRDNFNLAGGIDSGLLVNVTDYWKVEAKTELKRFFLEEDFTASKVSLQQNFRLAKDWALRVSLKRSNDFEYYWNEAGFALFRYF